MSGAPQHGNGMSILGSMSKYWHTLRYLRPVQFYGRLWFQIAKSKIDASTPPSRRPPPDKWIESAKRAPSLLGPDHFWFLNVEGKLSEVRWDGSEREKLWRYNQHYFDDLNAQDNQARSDWHRDLLHAWVEDNPPGAGTGWDPYPTSLRIVNWIKWAHAENTLSDALHHSLAIQTRWLMQRLEWHLLGNHLFSNAKALVFAGLYFQGTEAEKWLTKGFEILKREVPEQILSDGGHFERSTMYHALALEDMLDLCNVFRMNKASLDPEQQALTADWASRVDSMLFWHTAMCHPDGEISFFNDAAFGIAPSTDELFSYAARLGFNRLGAQAGITRLAHSGYTRLEAHDAVAIIDTAPIGPDYLPGHAHADTLSFELSLFGCRVFVNSGTSLYGLSDERSRQRGTKAHNTMVVDGENSSEVWSGFRAARRARPLGYKDESGTELKVACSHDGYMRIKGGPLHTRKWRLSAKQFKVEDSLSTLTFDSADARFHMHPNVDIKIDAENKCGTLLLSNGIEIEWQCEGGDPRVEQSTWHPEFGVAIPTACLIVPLKGGRADLSLSWV